MRKYFGSIVLVAGVAATAPLAAASAESDENTTAPTVAVQQVRVPAVGGLRDEAAMVLVGTALIGLAAAVRRAA